MSTLACAYEVTPAWPSCGVWARQMAAEAASASFALVVAMGGDGLVCHVSGGIADTATALGVIPIGTGNVLARSLGVPMRPRAAAELVAGEHALRAVPVVRLFDGHGRLLGQAVSQFGMGFDAVLAGEIERHRWAKRRLPNVLYAAISARIVLFERRQINAMRMHVRVAGRANDAVTVMAQVRYPYAYLGALRIRLTSTPTSRCDVLLAERFGPGMFIRALAQMAAGPRRLTRVSGIVILPDCAQLTIQAERAVPCQTDGELLGELSHVQVLISPDSLRVAVPSYTVAGGLFKNSNRPQP